MTMRVVHCPPEELAAMSARWLDENGLLKLFPASEFKNVPSDHLRAWCGTTGRYGIVTAELVDWLKSAIGGRRAIEIGAGIGDLGFHLGIPCTDSFWQTEGANNLVYQMLGQTPTKPGPHVQRFTADRAIRKLKPEVVVASWVTQRFVPGLDVEGEAQAFMAGVEEDLLLEKVQCYIHVGNDGVHGRKRILSRPHIEHSPQWLVSRAEDQSLNRIYVWG